MIKKLRNIVREHIASNHSNCFFLLLAFIFGVIVGAFTVNGLSAMQRDELSNYLQGFLQLFHNQNVNGAELFSMGLVENFKLIALLWVLGVTIIGIPFIFLVMSVRGFVTGFTSGFIINALGMEGILLAGFALFPKEIIIIPCLIGIGVNGINFSMRLAKNKTAQEQQKPGLKSAFLSYCLTSLLFTCITVIGVIIDAYVTPVLIRMIAPLVTI
ncbi:MAG TPA: stage II sporulation protein M [Clostridiales bacterium]|nr:stage II sporulation protein M [Clostridiales bacterium]HQD31509.1 stage II sporulation protein M [Clostridiales bacterium]